nr:acylglycerol kinase family protein [Desulfobacula sp.]
MRVALMVNPYSGGKKGVRLLPVIEKRLGRAGIEYHTHLSLYHEHTVKIASELDIARYDAIVAVGGDGTNFHVLNGLLSRFRPEIIPPLGILPIGSGNSFARDLGIFSLDDGLRSILENEAKWIDVCSFFQAEKNIILLISPGSALSRMWPKPPGNLNGWGIFPISPASSIEPRPWIFTIWNLK